MPENPTMFLNQISVTILDDLYTTFKEAAAAQNTSVEALLIESTRKSLGLGPSPRLPVDVLREKLIEELTLYVGGGVNTVDFLTQSPDHNVFAIVYIDKDATEHIAMVGHIVRIMGDVIVIEHDKTNKPLVEALIQAGVPRSQIILAYEGEPRPKTP